MGLEDLLSPEADAPLVFIKVIDQRKDSTDQGRLNIAIVPGSACGHKGALLTRDDGEDEDGFFARCSKRYDET